MDRKLPMAVEKDLLNFKALRLTVLQNTEIETKGQATCRPGCSACCSYPVLITVWEGLLLLRELDRLHRRTPALQTKIRDHATQTRGLHLGVWYLAGIPCPLLDSKQHCLAYKARPTACRVTTSSKLAEDCDPHRVGKGNLDPVPGHAVKELTVWQTQHLREHGSGPMVFPISQALRAAIALEDQETDLASVSDWIRRNP